jgi:pimeloyl-ACP methyl ester carboxylesterase
MWSTGVKPATEQETPMTLIGTRTCLALLAAIATIATAAPAPASTSDDVVSHIGSEAFALNLSGSRMLLPYESNHPIDRPAQFSELIILIHGLHREVKLGRALRDALGVDRPDALVLAPQFLKDRDRAAYQLPDNVLSWQANWAWGDPSSGPRSVSSFAATDQIILELLARYPSISKVVVMGNSAGGQFVQRYAALSATEDVVNGGGRRVAFRYLASNPSSYLYPDNRRVSPTGRIEVPPAAVVRGCPQYNSYGYGLDRPNPYAGRSSTAEITARMLRRNVIYFIGDDDNDENHPELDTNCGAEMQGAERFERSRNFWSYLVGKFGRAVLTNQRRICIERGTHDARTIWGTSCGTFYISDTGSCAPAPCPQ